MIRTTQISHTYMPEKVEEQRPKLGVLLSAGHGNYYTDPRTGKMIYTTAPKKQFLHTHGPEFHQGGWFYEGVYNHKFVKDLATALRKENFDPVIISHPVYDAPLWSRTKFANDYFSQSGACLLIDVHCNASPKHNAHGFECYTSPGSTKSDQAAQMMYENVEYFTNGEAKLRKDNSDGDHDKEARFWMLMATKCYTVLPELDYFDNKVGAARLMDLDYRLCMIAALAKTVVDFDEFLYGEKA